ncbi:MAG: gliding motility-associated C-terminal domain-containing protein [Bacteroidia bacterium]|nr:gliding motility-associated C-terminal domain-containing protein [Bacteroidia bacterium]
MRKHILFLVFSLILSFTSFAQIDTAFWFVAPDISSGLGDQPVYLRLMSYSAPSTVTIWQPANGAFVPISVSLPANAVDSVDLTTFLASIENDVANTTLTRGLRIHSTTPIGAIYEVRNGSNREFFTLKGQKAIGTDFYTPFQTFWANGVTAPTSFSSIEIVATQSATTVLITPRTAIVGHAANVTYSIILNAGETYCARDIVTSAVTSLTGSIVSANKPIAVTVYTGAVSESGCLSTMGDQITTSDQAGTDFIIHRATGNNERIYILATQNNTNIDVYGSSTSNAVINWSETHEYVIGTDTVVYVKTNKPVYVWHAAGFGCKLSGAQVPNLYCAGTYNTAFTRTSADSFALRLYVRTGFEGMFQVNGAAGLINATDFLNVPGTSGAFKSALIYFNTTQVPVNSYNQVSNTGDIFGLGILQGSAAIGSSYGYLSEFISYPFVDAGVDDTICANTSLSLSGIVGGGSVTGQWSGTGFGSFQNGLTALTNVYIPSPLDTAISPIQLILASTGPCPVQHDTITIEITPAPIVNASADQTICGNNPNVQLNGTVTGGATTGTWTSTGTGTFSPSATALNAIYTASPADTTAGTVSLILTSTNFGSCVVERDTMVVTITNSPYADAGPVSVTVCSNNALVTLNGLITGSSSTGKWISSGNGIFSPNNINLNATYSPDATDIAAGTVTLHLYSTNNGGCTAAEDSIIVIFSASPVVAAGPNALACNNNAVFTLAGSVSGPTTTGTWTGGSGTYNPNANTLTASYTPTTAEITSGSVILTLTSTNNAGCNAVSDNVKFDFVTPPFANFSATTECEGVSTSFTDFSLQGFGSINSWHWDFGDGDSALIQGPYHPYLVAGTYTVELIVGSTVGCSDTIVKSVTVYPIPVVDFNYSVVCGGTVITVNFTDSTTIAAPDSIVTWLWDFGGSGSSPAQNPSFIFTGTGSYPIALIVASNHGCQNSAFQNLNIPPRPSAGFYYNTSNGFSVGALVTFIDSSTNAVFYDWNYGDGTPHTTVQDTTHTYFSNGTFVITEIVSDSLGCSDTATAYIVINTVTNEITTLIPNAISPNGDGKNDVWKLSFINILYPNATVEIYNKWSQQIFFDNTGYVVPWDGTYHGSELPAGSYFYVINLNDPSQPDPYKGSILLVR